MCGIAGVVEFDPTREVSAEVLVRMAEVLRHRGPDAGAVYRAHGVGLAHRRLSIIDLEAGGQPMTSADGRVTVVFNGEIYNHAELRDELDRAGHRFRTRSDTEVLLAAFLAHDLDAFPRLNGMFACAFWDARARRLVLARDRLGKKPLFYQHDGRRLVFASEIKALLASGSVDRRLDARGLHEYLTFGYTAGERTILEGVHRLAPGHTLVLQRGRATVRRYWKLRFRPAERPPAEAEAVEHLGWLLRQAVRRRLTSDVPLGAFVSGGLDSSTVVALMAELSGGRVRTFTVGFDEAEYSELADARTVAAQLGTDHTEIVVRPDALRILPDLVWHLDEPLADSSAVPTYYVCRAARAHVTVALSGDGGDEVFAGYRRYQRLDRYRRMRLLPAWARRGMAAPLARALPFTWPGWNYLCALGRLNEDGLPAGLGMYPHIQERLLDPDLAAALRGVDPAAEAQRLLAEAAGLDPVSRCQYLDTLHYLPGDILTKVDRASMANSLEVRSPLLDHTVVEYLASLPVFFKIRSGVAKYLLREVAKPIVPRAVLEKPKQGFAIPKDRWFREELHLAAREILLDRRSVSRGYVRADEVGRLLRHHQTGRRDYSNWIWALLVLETWCRAFLDRPWVGSVGPRRQGAGEAAFGPGARAAGSHR